MILRGIQIVGLIIALFSFIFIFYARKLGRLDSRSVLFWILFWGIFVILDLYPSLARYLSPILSLQSNMYVLTAGSVLTLFILVFAMYSNISDLKVKVNVLIREQAILGGKLANLIDMYEKDDDE